MREQLQNHQFRIASRKPLGLTPLKHALPAPDAGSFVVDPTSGSQKVGVTLVQWRAETIRLREGVCWCNPWRGIPTGWQFEQLYREGHSPEAALTLWRDWEPWDEYTPPHDESWPPHDYD